MPLNFMDPQSFKQNFKFSSFIKVLGLGVLAIAVVVFLVSLTSSVFKSFNSPLYSARQESAGMALDSSGFGVQFGSSYAGEAVMDNSAKYSRDITMPPSIAPRPDYDQTTTGNTAEDFETKTYSGLIETRELKSTCEQILALKARPDVIFENANQSDTACYFSFKVERKNTEEILAIIKKLDPKDLNEDVYSLKNIIEDYQTETELLTAKRDSINQTLDSALKAYDEVIKTATLTHDTETLAKVIDSKINMLERLINESVNVNSQLERLAKEKAKQLDRLAYAYFNLNVVENKFIDGEALKDSWKMAVKQFVASTNRALQDISLNLASFIILIVKYLIYILIILLACKLVWQIAKRWWGKRQV